MSATDLVHDDDVDDNDDDDDKDYDVCALEFIELARA